MASSAPSQRIFESLKQSVHERLPFSVVKLSHSISTVFEESVYARSDQRRVLSDFRANGEKSFPETNDSSEKITYDEYPESVYVYVALSCALARKDFVWCPVMGKVELLSIPDSVEWVPDGCFSSCKSLSRVTFGESSSLKLIERGHSIEVAWSRFIFLTVLKNFVSCAFTCARVFRVLHLVNLLH